MRRGRAALVGALGLLLSLPAAAQTAVNPGALDALAPPPAAQPSPVKSAPAKTTNHKSAPAHHQRTNRPAGAAPLATNPAPGSLPGPSNTGHSPLPGKAAVARPGTLAIPAAPPPAPTLPPPIVVPTRPVPPPPPVPIAADAPGEAQPRRDGLRVIFGAGRTDMNPATDAALRALVHTAPPFAQTTFTVTAYAPGSPDDPSTPRRLSLSRALAVRSVLLAEGIPSARITVRALGATGPDLTGGPPDRVDVAVAGNTPQAQPAAP